MIPLALAREGERVKVSRVSGGRGLVRRMTDLGLRPGTEIEIVSASRTGPFVIRLGEQRLGVGFGMAKKIFVDLVM
jgi:ferrous iron transport protein A